MMLASLLEPLVTILGVIAPLVAVPLTIITFYLRSLRDHQLSWHGEFIRRVENVEASIANLRKILCEYERDYTTKEEWLREYMHARRSLEQVTETTVRIETTMQMLLAGNRPAFHLPDGPTGVGHETSVRNDQTRERNKDDN